MNRKIQFRGFHSCDGPNTIVVDGKKVKGRWVEGDFLSDCNGDTYITAFKFIPGLDPARCEVIGTVFDGDDK